MVRKSRQAAAINEASVPLALPADQDMTLQEAMGTDFDPSTFDKTPTEVVQSVADSTRIPDPVQSEQPTTTMTTREAGAQKAPEYPNPRGIASINLTDKNDGPLVHLLEHSFKDGSERRTFRWLQFDEKPEPEIIQQLRAGGMEWVNSIRHTDLQGKEHKGAWVKEVDPSETWRARAETDRLLKSIGNSIREKNGLEPVTLMGVPDR